MKSKILIIITMVIVINAIFLNINIVRAEGISDVIKGGDQFINSSQNGSVSIDTNKLNNASSMLYNVLLALGVCIAVLISAILGVKFMIGSVEEKAQIKDAMVPFIIGCIVVFGAFGIWKIFVTIGNNL